MHDLKLPLMAAVSSALLAGCSPGGPPRKVCVDGMMTRVDDRRCDDEDRSHVGGSYFWYYLPERRSVVGVGGVASGGSFVPDESVGVYARASAAGEDAVARGGFGRSAGEAEGHGGSGE